VRALYDAEAKVLGSSVGRDKCVQHAEANILGPSVKRDRCIQHAEDNVGVCDCRQDMDWILDLLATCIHPLEIHFTDH
jgi:hypothetical protein